MLATPSPVPLPPRGLRLNQSFERTAFGVRSLSRYISRLDHE